MEAKIDQAGTPHPQKVFAPKETPRPKKATSTTKPPGSTPEEYPPPTKRIRTSE